MRIKCLELATAQGLKGAEAIKAAAAMMNFAREGSILDAMYGPGHGEREMVKRHVVDTTSLQGPFADRIETPTATVHRRPPFLDDYKPE